jgi:hypothetical protein
MRRVEQEALVTIQHIGRHRRDRREHQMLDPDRTPDGVGIAAVVFDIASLRAGRITMRFCTYRPNGTKVVVLGGRFRAESPAPA